MSKTRAYQFSGVNLSVNPLLQKPGDLLRAVNVDTFPYGAKKKRSGYGTYLGTMPNGSVVQELANFTKGNGTQFWNYAFAGGNLYYSTQGTGAWTICGNGTFSPSGTLTTTVLLDTMYVCDGVGTINYTTTGTSFINNGTVLYNGTSTTPAPIAVSLQEYQFRVYAAGTSGTLSWSNAGTGNDWTNDSTTLGIPGKGNLKQLFKANDRLVITKTSGNMFRWDGFNLLDLVTDLGPTSTTSVDTIEDSWFMLNNLGVYNYSGNKPALISQPITRQFYNDSGSAMVGTSFSNAPGVTHQNKYYLGVGTTTDDLTGETVNNCIMVYDYLYNEWSNYSLAHNPTAFLSYKDSTGLQQLLFSSGSQVYQFSGTALSDAGSPISTVIQGVLNFGAPETDQEYKYAWAFFNPGAQARVQVAPVNTFTKGKLNWIDLGDTSDGVAELRFPAGPRSKFLMYRITETSGADRYNFYGISTESSPVERT